VIREAPVHDSRRDESHLRPARTCLVITLATAQRTTHMRCICLALQSMQVCCLVENRRASETYTHTRKRTLACNTLFTSSHLVFDRFFQGNRAVAAQPRQPPSTPAPMGGSGHLLRDPSRAAELAKPVGMELSFPAGSRSSLPTWQPCVA
jgi:hypothetical protein